MQAMKARCFQVASLLLCSHAALASLPGLPDFKALVEPPVFKVWKAGMKFDEPNEPIEPIMPIEPIEPLQFPLQSTHVQAEVANGVAYAKVIQVYYNAGVDCLHSRYIFPLPAKAAICNMTMRVGDRTIIGKIRTKEDARQEFEKARTEGKTASLLDQERPNVFAMELANILPGQTTEVVVEYVETLSPIDGIYAFTFPSVVGPRYGKGWEPGQDTSDLEVKADLFVSPAPLGHEGATSSTLVANGSPGLTASAVNRDIIIKYWLTENSCSSSLLLGQRGDEKYFSLAIQPPQRRLLQSDQISKREYLFILDTSGSMTGYPIQLSKQLMTNLLKKNVRHGDVFNIMCFAGGSAVLSEKNNVVANAESIDEAQAWLNRHMQAGGGTELLPALQRAFALPRSTSAASRNIIVMTDGYVTVEKQSFDVIRENLGDGNVFVFGIGGSVNRYLIEGMARVGFGEPFIVTSEAEGPEVSAQLQKYIDAPVLTRLRLNFEGPFQPVAMEPPFLPDVFASRPVTVVGKWTGQLSGSVSLIGKVADGATWEYQADLAQMEISDVPAVPLLWARARIATISDYASVQRYGNYGDNDGHKAEVTALGLNYSLMTEYTSFVAVDSHPSAPEVCSASPTTTQASNAPDKDDVHEPLAEMASGMIGGQHDVPGTSSSRPLRMQLLPLLLVLWTLALRTKWQ